MSCKLVTSSTFPPFYPKFEDLSEPESSKYSPTIFQKIFYLFKYRKENRIISEFKMDYKLCERRFRIIYRNDDKQEVTFLILACQFHAERVVTWMIGHVPESLNINYSFSPNPIKFLINKVDDTFGSSILLDKLLNHSQNRFYEIVKKCVISSRKFILDFNEINNERATPLLDKPNDFLADRIKKIANEETLEENLIFRTVYLGKKLMFEKILGYYSKDEEFKLFKEYTYLPFEIVLIIKDYYSYFITERVREIATLTCETTDEYISSIEERNILSTLSSQLHGNSNMIRGPFLEYKTLFQEILVALNMKAFTKAQIKPYIEIAKILIDCGENENRFPAGRVGNKMISIRELYEEHLPGNFFDRLKMVDVDTLTEEVFNFNLR